jgi:hypothetical protein
MKAEMTLSVEEKGLERNLDNLLRSPHNEEFIFFELFIDLKNRRCSRFAG